MPTRLSIFGLKVQESPAARTKILAGSAAALGLLVGLEWSFRLDVSLGVLYSIPMAMAAVVLNRTQVVALALTCAFVRGQFTTNLSQLDGLLRFLMATMAYAGAGLLVVEVSN
ncbi:MAG: hypothetical protein JNM66_31415, partial [Bryobacterales bacterium]|nr:hypothetical protein [Bryobacterales bacterium]